MYSIRTSPLSGGFYCFTYYHSNVVIRNSIPTTTKTANHHRQMLAARASNHAAPHHYKSRAIMLFWLSVFALLALLVMREYLYAFLYM